MATLQDCFGTLKATPPALVARHAALVSASDDFDNCEKSNELENAIYTFECHKENLFFKYKCVILVWALRIEVSRVHYDNC